MTRSPKYVLKDRTRCQMEIVNNTWNSILKYTNISVEKIEKINGITIQYCSIHSNSLDYTTLCCAMATHFEISQKFNHFILRCQDYKIQEAIFFVDNQREIEQLKCYLLRYTGKDYTKSSNGRIYYFKSIIIGIIDNKVPLTELHVETKEKWKSFTHHSLHNFHIKKHRIKRRTLKILGILQADSLNGIFNGSNRTIYLVGEAHTPLRIDKRIGKAIIPVDELYKTIFTFTKLKIDFYLESPVTKERLVGGSEPMTWGSLRVLRDTFFNAKDLDPITLRPNLKIYGKIGNENKIRAHWNDVRQSNQERSYEFYENNPMNNLLRILHERKKDIGAKNLREYVSDYCNILPQRVEFSHVFKYVFYVYEHPLTYQNQEKTHKFLKDKYDQKIKNKLIRELKLYLQIKTQKMRLIEKFTFLVHRIVGIYTILRIHHHREQTNIIIHTGFHHTQFVMHCLTKLFNFKIVEQSNINGKISIDDDHNFKNKSDISRMKPWFFS